MNNAPNHEARIRVIWILHLAFIIAVFLYAAVTVLFILPLAPSEPPDPMLTLAVLVVLSASSFAASLLLPTVAPMLMPTPDDPPEAFINKTTQRMIVTDAFYEAIAIYGLVAVLLGAPLWQGLAAMVLSGVLLAAQSGAITGWLDEYRRRAKNG